MKNINSLRFLLTFFVVSMCVSASARSHWNERMYYDTPVTLSDSFVAIPSPDYESKSLFIEARGAMKGIGERAGLAPAYWGLKVAAGNDSVIITMRHGNTDFGDMLDKRFTRVSVSRNGEELKSSDFTDGFATSAGGYNTLFLELDSENNKMKLLGGNHSCEKLIDMPLDGIDLSDVELSVWSKGELSLSSLSMEAAVAPESKLMTEWDAQKMDEYFSRSLDPVEGYWEYLDRKNDPLYARLGGRYVIAVVKNSVKPDRYDLIYMAGAETLASRWKPYMLKGRLLPTIFQSHYDLHWYDSTFEPITADLHASIEDNAILTLSFPLLKTVLRFSKASDDKKRKTYKEQSQID